MSGRRPRVLHVTRNLPPLVGGMERLNWHIAEELSRVAEVHVVGPEGFASLAPPNVQATEVPLRPLWRFLMASTWQAIAIARRFRPDIVLAGSGLTAPSALLAARACGARSAAYVHGLDVAVRHLVYRAGWVPAIRSLDRVIANSALTAQLCRDIGVAGERVGIVHPGVELPSATETSLARSAAAMFRERQGLQNRVLLLTVGRLSTRKGMREFVVESLPRIVAKYPDAMLLIVGDAPVQALHAEIQTPASIQAAADAAGVGQHIRFLGVITDFSELSAVYRAADVHVFPVRSIPGDPEGFGMVAVEAAAHGLPTVAFATGGVVDAVSEGLSGTLVSPGDYADMAAAVCRVLADGDAWKPGCLEFSRKFAWPRFGKDIVDQLRRVDFHEGVDG